MPGIGTVTLAILLTEAGDPLARRDYAALRTLSGVAPVTERSGKTRIVVMRHAAQVRLRRESMQTCGDWFASGSIRAHGGGRGWCRSWCGG